ncbi:MAG: acyltransferase [bacterium]
MPKAPHIHAIDGLRGVAALGIVLYHMRATLAYSPELKWAAGGFEKYYLLLDLFFIVTGFSIASGYAETFERRFTAREYGRFLWGRFARLYPLYLCVLLVLAAQETIYLFTDAAGLGLAPYPPWGRSCATPETFVTSLFMLQSWGFHDKLVWNIPAWYVSALVVAYLAFPGLARVTSLLSPRLRAVILVGLASAAAVALHAASAAGAFPRPMDLSPVRAIVEFSVGYGLARLEPGPAWRRHLQLPLLLLAGVGLHAPWPDCLTLALLGLGFWTLLEDRGLVAAPLRTQPLVWLGGISYAVFLVHHPMIGWFNGLHSTSLSVWLPLLWTKYLTANIVLRFVVIVLVAWLATRALAEPARRWLQPR